MSTVENDGGGVIFEKMRYLVISASMVVVIFSLLVQHYFSQQPKERGVGWCRLAINCSLLIIVIT